MISIQCSFDLSLFNTLGVPSVCEYYCNVTTQEELIEAILFARKKESTYYILGGGSNVLLPPKITGLVIQLSLLGVSHQVEDNNVILDVAAGENWHRLVERTLENKWYGLENLSLIPGSVGAAPIQNIGAYGVELKDVCRSVTVLNTSNLLIEELANEQCQFAYRESLFKTRDGRSKYIVIRVSFKLSLSPNVRILYPALRESILKRLGFEGPSDDIVIDDGYMETVTPELVSETVVSLRRSKLPNPNRVPNVGSFFKNPSLSRKDFEIVQETFPYIPYFADGSNRFKIPAAWLIDQSGWKGKEIDGVGVHSKQALVLVNLKNRPLHSILKLAEKIQQDVLSRFGITLDIEPQALAEKR